MDAYIPRPDRQARSLLIQWGLARDDVRAAILTSSQVIPGAPLDALSDYDVIYYVRDLNPYLESDDWLYDFGKVLVLYRNPVNGAPGARGFAYITQYEDTKIDFSIAEVGQLAAVVADAARGKLDEDFDLGYAVLFDKDGLAAGLPPPTGQAYILQPPSEALYRECVELFFHEGTYAAKNLWRQDLMAARYFLGKAMRLDNLKRMLEWSVGVDCGWSLRMGVLGRGLMKRLPPDLRAGLEATYAGPALEDNWQSLFDMAALFRRAGQKVGAALGYAYPLEIDRGCVEYYRRVKNLPRE
jgi:aminoglycoside 6-adenylyltransferase